jgi:hypothetical protein
VSLFIYILRGVGAKDCQPRAGISTVNLVKYYPAEK